MLKLQKIYVHNCTFFFLDVSIVTFGQYYATLVASPAIGTLYNALPQSRHLRGKKNPQGKEGAKERRSQCMQIDAAGWLAKTPKRSRREQAKEPQEALSKVIFHALADTACTPSPTPHTYTRFPQQPEAHGHARSSTPTENAVCSEHRGR